MLCVCPDVQPVWSAQGCTIPSLRGLLKGHLLRGLSSIISHQICTFTSQQTDRETVETVADFIFLGSKITADGDCSHEMKIHLLLGRKVMTNLDSILKSRDITLPTKVH